MSRPSTLPDRLLHEVDRLERQGGHAELGESIDPRLSHRWLATTVLGALGATGASDEA
jgi:hypothetical protein